MTTIRFPATRFAVVWLLEATEGGWIVLAPRGAWLHGSRAAALRDAAWLAANLNIPIRSEFGRSRS